MEAVLDLYEEPPDPHRPYVCFDERPCQLLSHMREPLSMRPGNGEYVDYEYKREGTCCVLLAFDPLRGWRKTWVLPQRRKVDFAACIRELIEEHYSETEQVRLVCDNLNTHNGSSFYEAFEAEEARRICRKISFVYTPKHGSWLNMAEIELSTMERQCLSRRLSSREAVADEVGPWERERNERETSVKWRFTTGDARIKLKSLYPSL